MNGKATARAQRTARAVEGGPEILHLLNTPELRGAVLAAAEAGYPPVAAVSQKLLDEIGPDILQTSAAKMFVGLCISAILEDKFRVSEARVRMSKDPIFRTGAVYSKIITEIDTKEADILERFLASLSDQEADRALGILKRRIAGPKKRPSSEK